MFFNLLVSSHSPELKDIQKETFVLVKWLKVIHWLSKLIHFLTSSLAQTFGFIHRYAHTGSQLKKLYFYPLPPLLSTLCFYLCVDPPHPHSLDEVISCVDDSHCSHLWMKKDGGMREGWGRDGGGSVRVLGVRSASRKSRLLAQISRFSASHLHPGKKQRN